MQILQAVNKTYYLLTLFPCIFSALVTSSTAYGEVMQDIKGSSTAVVCAGRERRSPEGSTGKTWCLGWWVQDALSCIANPTEQTH